MWHRIALSGARSQPANLYNDVIRACDVQLVRWHSDGSEYVWLNDEALRLYRDTGGTRQVEESADSLSLVVDVESDELLGTRLLSFRAARVGVTMALKDER